MFQWYLCLINRDITTCVMKFDVNSACASSYLSISFACFVLYCHILRFVWPKKQPLIYVLMQFYLLRFQQGQLIPMTLAWCQRQQLHDEFLWFCQSARWPSRFESKQVASSPFIRKNTDIIKINHMFHSDIKLLIDRFSTCDQVTPNEQIDRRLTPLI